MHGQIYRRIHFFHVLSPDWETFAFQMGWKHSAIKELNPNVPLGQSSIPSWAIKYAMCVVAPHLTYISLQQTLQHKNQQKFTTRTNYQSNENC